LAYVLSVRSLSPPKPFFISVAEICEADPRVSEILQKSSVISKILASFIVKCNWRPAMQVMYNLYWFIA
jgi:hypothetical protein